MIPVRVIWLIALLAGAEVVTLDQLADSAQAHREKTSTYSRAYDAAKLPTEAQTAAAQADWDERNLVCADQCGIDKDAEGGGAELPCEDNTPESEDSTCRLSDKYMLETEERAGEFLQLRSTLLMAKVTQYVRDCSHDFSSQILRAPELVMPSNWGRCDRVTQEMWEAISFISKARAVIGDVPKHAAVVDQCEHVMKYATSLFLPAGGLSAEDMDLFHKLAEDSNGRQREFTEKYPMFVAQNAAEILVALLQGSSAEKELAASRVRSGAVFELSEDQLEIAEEMERRPALSEADTTVAMSHLMAGEDEMDAKVTRAIGNEGAGGSALVELSRFVSSEGAVATRDGSVRGGEWAGGVLFVLVGVGALAFALFAFGALIWPWVLIAVAAVIVGCGLAAGVSNIWKSFWKRSETEKLWKKQEEERAAKLKQKEEFKASGGHVGQFKAALGLKAAEKEVAAAPAGKERWQEILRAKNGGLASDPAQSSSGSGGVAGAWGNLVGGFAGAANTVGKGAASVFSQPAQPAKDDWDRDIDEQIASAQAEWAKMRKTGSLVQAEECAHSTTKVSWLRCTGRVLWSPFWLLYKAGTLTFKAFG